MLLATSFSPGDWASIAVAGATFLLALFAALSVGQVWLDRRAALVPNLTVRYPTDPRHENPDREEIEVVNIGRGPAVNCVYIGNIKGRWFRADIYALRGQERVEAVAELQRGQKPEAVVAALRWSDTQELHRVVVCEDTRERYYRFSDKQHDRWPRRKCFHKVAKPKWTELRP